jgi:hypothetical protein
MYRRPISPKQTGPPISSSITGMMRGRRISPSNSGDVISAS